MNSVNAATGLLRRLVSMLLASLLFCPVAWAAETLRVGVYFNPPLSFVDENGKPSGFIIDLLEHIAPLERWQLEYVPCTWEACNELLNLGHIDMLSPIARNDARARRLDFNRESLYVNWGQIVTAGAKLDSLLELASKTVVVLSSDVHFADLKELSERFDIAVRFLEVDDYEAVLAWVSDGPADAGLVNRALDIEAFPQYSVEKSPVIFNPAEIRIALSPRNDQLQNALRIQSLDYQLSSLKGNQDSIYYQLQEHWFGRPDADAIPSWLFWLLGIALGVSLLLAAGVLLLRQQVQHRTADLRRVSERFTAFMNNLPGIAYMKDLDGRYIFVNPSWERANHLAAAEVLGRTAADIWPKQEPGVYLREERRALEQGQVVESIQNDPWSDRTRYWRLISFPVEDSAGVAVMLGGIGLDITGQRETERELTRVHQQLRLLMESAGEGIFGLDGHGRCTFVNQAALKLLGYQRDELIGNNMHNLIQHSRSDGSSYPEQESAIYQAFRQGRTARVQSESFWRADGSQLPVEFSARPIAEKELPGAVVVFRELRT
jgi:PAS domain S-box-containing protein